MAVYPSTSTVDYGASDPQSYLKGAAGINALAQSFAQRQAGQQIAAGDPTDAASTLYSAGDLAGGTQVASQHQAVLDASAAKDRQAHADSLKFIQDTATALDQVRQAQGNDAVLDAFDKMAPMFAQREGASPDTIAQIRQQLQTNPQAFLETMATHAQHQLQILSPGQQAIDEQGNVRARAPLAPTYHMVGPDQSLVRDDPNAPAGANSFAPQGGQPGALAATPGANGPPPPPAPPVPVNQAIIGQESRGNPNVATSVNGAHGIGQIIPSTFRAFARPGERISNPTDNLNVANRIIDHYSAAYNGDPERVAVAYFSGPGNVAPPGSPTPWIRDARDGNGIHTSQYVHQVLGRMGVAPAGPPQGTPPAGVTTSGGATVIAQGPPKAPPPAQPFTLGPGATRYDASGRPIVTAPARPAAGAGKLPTQDAARLKAMDSMVDNADVLNNMAQDWISRAHGANTGWWYNSIGGHQGSQGQTGGIQPGQVINAAINPDMRSQIQELNAISNRATPMLRPTGSGRILGAEYTNFANAFPNTRNDPAANQHIAEEYAQQLGEARQKVTFFHAWAAAHGNLDGVDQAWIDARHSTLGAGNPVARRRTWTPQGGLQ